MVYFTSKDGKYNTVRVQYNTETVGFVLDETLLKPKAGSLPQLWPLYNVF